MTDVGILHPGAMGAEVGAALVDGGHHVWWASAGRSSATTDRARDAGLRDAASVPALLDRCEVVLSICPPAAALDVGRLASSASGTFVDANAVSPATAAEVAAAVGGRTVDGGIVGPPPALAGTTRLFLSGADASRVAEVLGDTRLEVVVLAEGGPFAASALKMSYAAWTKGSAALLLATAETAREVGVLDALLAEWARSQPQLADRLASARGSADAKGWRWEAEMREIAATFTAAGQPSGFHEAAAEVFGGRDAGPADA